MRKVLFLCLVMTILTGCEGEPLHSREAGALGGGALGAGLGAIIGHQVGSTGAGVAIGSAFGALSGALVGNELDKGAAAQDQNDRLLLEQQRRLEENRKLIDELKGRGTDVTLTKRGVVVNLPDVLFEFNSARITAEARRSALQVAEVIKKTPDRRVSVEGHTDSLGTYEYNEKLSRHRAEAVAEELVSNGVPRARLAVRGLGERDPVASNKSEAGRQRNRRVEVIIEN